MKMTGIELEEGEAYFFQDDDEKQNIDPDKDFSYIDKKIENVLGQDQKDFMVGLSAESLGARFGGYGSFLPMQQRSPPILSNQRNQSHVSLKSPQDLPSEHFHQNPAFSANHPVPARSIPSAGDQNAEALSETGISSMNNNQLKIQSSGAELPADQQKKKVMIHPEKNILKFRVKMASENISRLDKSAIYSGLGLDMSPTSSPEGSPSENDGTLFSLQETNLESPSSIVKSMTTMPLSCIDLLSPLHDSLVYLKGMEYSLGANLSGSGEAYSFNTFPESMHTKGKKEGRKERKSKVKDASKFKKSKHKDVSEEKPSKQKAPSQKSAEPVKENCEYPANIVAPSASRKEEGGASIANEVFSNASIGAVVACSEDMELASSIHKNMGSNPCTVFDKRNEAGWLGEDPDSSMKQAHLAMHKTKEGSSSAKKQDIVENGMSATSLRGKIEKDKSINFISRGESSTDKREEIGCVEGEVNKSSKQCSISMDKAKDEFFESADSKERSSTLVPKSESIMEKRNEARKENDQKKFFKPQSMAKDKVKEEVHDSPCSIGDAVYKKENLVVEKNVKDEEVCFLAPKGEESEYNDVSQDMKFDNADMLEPLKKKSHSRGMNLSLAEQALCNEKENSSSVVKKNLKGSRIGGVSTVEPSKRSLIGSSAAPQNARVLSKSNIPSNNSKGDADLHRKMRKNIDVVAGKGNSRKKGKQVSSKDLVEVFEPEAPGFTTKLKDKSSNSKPDIASNIVSNMDGDPAGVNCMLEKVGDVPPVENAQLVTTLEDWVECEKCHKWRLLPLGTSADSLTEEEWTCSMITWLPGMNKCSFSEDETTLALRALYVPLDPAMAQNSQPAYLDADAAKMSSDALNALPPNHATGFDALPSGGKKKNLVKTEIDASRQIGIQDMRIPVKKNQRHFGEMKNSKNMKKLPRESNSGRKSGDGKMSKAERKRVADVEPYVVSKKMKTGHQQPVEDNLSGPLVVSQDLAKVSSKYPTVKAKDRNHSYMASMDEMYDVSGKKRKLKDKQHLVAGTSGKGGNLVENCDVGGAGFRKEKKTKSSNFQARESSAVKRRQRTHSVDPLSTLGDLPDRSLPQGARSVDMPMEQNHGDRVSRKKPGSRTSSEMALDLGFPDNAATSSSSKISRKAKAKVQGVKSSSAASYSTSPSKALTSDPDKGTNKKFASQYEQRLKSGAESGANEFALHNESFRDRKSNLSKNYVSYGADEDHFVKKLPSGRHSNSHAINAQTNLENCKGTGGKLDPVYEGASSSQQNMVTEIQVTKSPFKLPFDGTNSDKGKSRLPKIDSEKEVSSNSHGVPDFEGGSGPVGGRIDNVNGMPSRQVVAGHVSLKQWHNTGQALNDIEASGSRKKDNVHGAAKTALREATDLKHSANRLRIAGSGLESTGIFFQAALKFLHGASLLEPGDNESRSGETTTPDDVYASTAKLCEYCAVEYERCNDMASAALAFKCMEVAYMRVVYCKDLAASRDRQELQMAVRAAPQVDSPSSSASDIDNLNQAAIDTVKDGHSAMDHRSHIVSAGNRPNLTRLLEFTLDINNAMEASRRSQGAFAAAMPVFSQAGNEEGISSVKSVLDFSFHDINGLLHLVRLAMESIKS